MRGNEGRLLARSRRDSVGLPVGPGYKNSSQNRFFQFYFFRKSCKCLALTIFFLLLPLFGRFCSGAYRGIIIIIISCLKVDVLYSKTPLKTISRALGNEPGSTPPRARDILYMFSNIKDQLLDIKIDELRNYGMTELRNYGITESAST